MSEAARGEPTVAPAPGGGHWLGRFSAMAGPCEVLVEAQGEAEARRLTGIAAAEAWRIESKFSRYRPDSVVGLINAAGGEPVTVDEETAGLLDFAARCHELSGGRFDITTGVLRRVWRFDGSDSVPDRGQVRELLPLVGWRRVRWRAPELVLPAGMEIDLGGIGKEYAVDRAAELVGREAPGGVLVNFGGDMRALAPPAAGPWRVGIEDPEHERTAARRIELERGALATSGDARRFLLRRGVRYGHVLDPRTGWPVVGAARSVTVLADGCLEAGTLATIALLHGWGAERFLRQQGARHWIDRGRGRS